jgi:Uma2 family endonuclease
VQVMAMELRIPVRSGGSTTLKREDLERGAEADECFYVQNEAAVRAKRRLDLTQDPPPDLAVEIERTHAPIDKPSVYAALGVNEIWKYNGQRLTVLVLDRMRSEPVYRTAERSDAFPFLRPADLEPFIARAYSTDATTLLIEFRNWVAANLTKE